MPCFRPLEGWRSRTVSKSGKRPIVFRKADGLVDRPVQVPCGQCIGCRLERSRQWAVRCVHEASLYTDNCFVTLTYDDEHLPGNLSVDVTHFQKFMKRLRKKQPQVRYFHCGEYGDKGGRPHYHACLFNYRPSDLKLWSVRDGIRLYTSDDLSRVWSHGYVVVGDVSFESAAYVARYVMKKITGVGAEKHYAGRSPEYVTMSRRPGIGAGWYAKFAGDVFPSDEVVLRGIRMGVPKYYDKLFEEGHPAFVRLDRILEPSESERRRSGRVNNPFRSKVDNTSRRLRDRELVKEAAIRKLVRNLED